LPVHYAELLLKSTSVKYGIMRSPKHVTCLPIGRSRTRSCAFYIEKS
jgi:hypothetical protein